MPRHCRSLWPAVAAGVTLMAAPVPAPATGILSAADRQALQEILEHEVSGAPHRLPGGLTVTITETRTRPAICRIFRAETGPDWEESVACRTGPGQWEIGVVPPESPAEASPTPDGPPVPQSSPSAAPAAEAVAAGPAVRVPARRPEPAQAAEPGALGAVPAEIPAPGRKPQIETTVRAAPEVPRPGTKPLPATGGSG